MKKYILLSWRYDWEIYIGKMEGVFRSYLLTRTSSEWDLVGQFSGYVEGTQPARFQDLRFVARLSTAFNRVYEPRTSNLYYRHLKQYYLNLKEKRILVVKYLFNTFQILRDDVFEGQHPDAQIHQIWDQVECLLRAPWLARFQGSPWFGEGAHGIWSRIWTANL